MGMKKWFKYNKKNVAIALLLSAFVMSGCANGSATDSSANDKEKNEESADLEKNTFDDLAADENPSSSESSSDSPADANRALYQSYLDNKVKVDGTYFRDKYEDLFNDFGEINAYYYDMDDDGQDELLINMLYYGFDIYDIKDGEIYFLTGGEGTSGVCTLYEVAGNVYVGHSDFTHAGRQYLQMTRYDESGKIVDEFDIRADYSDSESDMYDENSTFTCNNEPITMEEYEKYMDSYHYIDPEEMEKAEFEPFN